ncbi:hypothetical protein DLAC_10195 [Tieghemostelium lacteum]|uniref:Uncharacterized protein n=1 Tax=Tieghemostelium lacteum TaxID=361077 RepID=A0A151Z4V8_TIELA|nr:hypothetical protein DLAC_10195 [Tieghemostelium lacteum]|eukprot:KYQ88981.1 hypothetical protein DLAC_10195 [Tieghemostelium lacteum]
MDNEDVIPASSSWRKHALYTGKRFKKTQITFEKLNDNTIDNITASAQHNISNQIILSDTSTKRDVCRILSINNNKKDGTNGKVQMSIHSEFIQESTFRSISWHNESLICGSNDGQIHYYHCDPNDSRNDPTLRETFTLTKLKGFNQPGAFTSNTSSSGATTKGSSKDLTTPSQYQTGFNTSIKSVQISPLSTSNFGCLENNYYHYWDFSDAVRPTISFRVSDYNVNTLSYSPHTRHYTIFGSQENSIKITDTRLMSSYNSTKKSPIVWSNGGKSSSISTINRQNLSASIRDIAWHPYVPYWFASANDHGEIAIWDLRTGSSSLTEPMIQFSAHVGSISKISWCPMHSELLSSSSYDGEYKMWSLLNEPHYNLFSKDDISPFIYTGFFDNDGYNNYAVSQQGDVFYSNISQKFMNTVQSSKFDVTERSEKSVERLIYNRDFTRGFEKAIQLSNKHSRLNNIEKAKNLLSLCFQTNIDDSLSDVIKRLNNTALQSAASTVTRKEFLQDLENFSYFIPPGYHERYGTKLSQALMTKIKELKVNLDIQYHIKNSSGEELVEIEREILSTLKSDHSSIRIENICDLVQVYLNYDQTKCYQFAIQIIEIFKNKLTNVQPMIRLLLHPTIFERKIRLSDSTIIHGSSTGSLSSSTEIKQTLSPSPLISRRSTTSAGSGGSSTPLGSNQTMPPPSPSLTRSIGASSPLTSSGNNIPTSPSDIEEFRLSEYLNTPEQILQQLTFSKEFFKILFSPSPIGDGSNPDVEDIIDYSSKHRPKLLLSMPINRIYLSILSDLFIYDQFYIVLLNLMNTINEDFEFYQVLQEHYQASTPDFIQFIKNSQIRDRIKPWDTERYSVPLLTVISILYNVSYQSIPSELYETLSQAIPILVQEIDNSLVSTLQQPDPQQPNLTGKQQSSNKAKNLLEFIRSITTTTNSSNTSQTSTPKSRTTSTPVSVNRNSTSIQSPQISLELQSHINSLTLVLNKYI